MKSDAKSRKSPRSEIKTTAKTQRSEIKTGKSSST